MHCLPPNKPSYSYLFNTAGDLFFIFYYYYFFLVTLLTVSGFADTDIRCAPDLLFIIKWSEANNKDQYRYYKPPTPHAVRTHVCLHGRGRSTSERRDLCMSHTRSQFDI